MKKNEKNKNILKDSEKNNGRIIFGISPLLEYRYVPNTHSGADLGLSAILNYSSESSWNYSLSAFSTFIADSSGYAIFLGRKFANDHWYGTLGLGNRYLSSSIKEGKKTVIGNEVYFGLRRNWLGITFSIIYTEGKPGYSIIIYGR